MPIHAKEVDLDLLSKVMPSVYKIDWALSDPSFFIPFKQVIYIFFFYKESPFNFEDSFIYWSSFIKMILLTEERRWNWSSQQTVDKNKKSDQENDRVNQFIIFCQPIRQVNIKILFIRIRVFTSNQGNRTHSFKENEDETFQKHKVNTDPNPFVNFINNYCV